jgi:hypothetical protein
MKIKRENCAWAAGFFDGEGSVSFVRYLSKASSGNVYQKYRLGMQAAQLDRELLDRLCQLTGLGVVCGTYDTTAGGFGKYRHYRWCVSSFEEIQAAIAMFWPWLSEKRRREVCLAVNSYVEQWRKFTPAQKRKSCAVEKWNRAKRFNGDRTRRQKL